MISGIAHIHHVVDEEGAVALLPWVLKRETGEHAQGI